MRYEAAPFDEDLTDELFGMLQDELNRVPEDDLGVDHVRLSHSAGDGYTEPREYWETCTCGATIFTWQQFYEETPGNPDDAWAIHLEWVATRSQPGEVFSCG